MDKSKLVAVGKSGAKKLRVLAIDPTRAVEEMARAYRDYQVIREQERTKRRGIEADETVALAEIAAKRELFLEYLTRSFDERSTNFASLFERVDSALEKGDVQALALLTNAIVDLAKSSPFKDLATIDATRKALKNPDHEWEV
jgi:hypothetical protein